MTLSTKETELLKDMKGQEELCIKKYDKYAKEAKSSELRCLFESMSKTEATHLKTVTDMMAGKEPENPAPLSADNTHCVPCNDCYQNAMDKEADAFLIQDMLATEKHASSLYNTSIFEFKSPAARKMLNHIESEEQQHGEQLYAYMNANNMYS